MRSINTVDDLKCFQGCIVVFTIDYYYMDHAFSTDDNPELKYGIVYGIQHITDEYLLQKFLFRNIPRPFAFRIGNKMLKKCKLDMRAATMDEIEIIRNAVSNNQAHNFISSRGRPIRWDLHIEKAKRFEDV